MTPELKEFNDYLLSGGIGEKTKAADAIKALQELRRVADSLGQDCIGDICKIRSLDVGFTEPDRATLLRFPGWGPLKHVFDDSSDATWQSHNQALRQLLTESEYLSARSAILSAHYTTPGIITGSAMILKRLGFADQQHWRVLDPSCGIGYFHLFMQSVVRGNWTMIDLDPVSAAIAHILSPSASVINAGFQNVELEPNSFDLITSNFPFGSYKVVDRYLPQFSNEEIHNYFALKSLHLLKPGGILLFITSSGFMGSKTNQELREQIAAQAKLLTAFRLPSNTFKPFGTEVTTDLLVFQKRSKPIEAPYRVPNYGYEGYDFDHGWHMLANSRIWDEENRRHYSKPYYFKKFESRQLGQDYEDKLYGGRLGCKPHDSDDTECVVNRLYDEIDKLDVTTEMVTELPEPTPVDEQAAPTEIISSQKIGEFFEYGDSVWQKTESFKAVEAPIEKHETIRRFLRLYEALETVLSNQSSPNLQGYQKHLRASYDSFVAKTGRISSAEAENLFDEDWRYDVLCTLEIFSGKKFDRLADVFTRQVGGVPEVPVSSTEDVLFLSLDRRGRIDFRFMANHLGKTETEIRDELSATGHIFYDPSLQEWVYRDEYLSGHVVNKLAIAREREMTANVAALEKVQPLIILPPAQPDIRTAVAVALGGVERCNLDPGVEISLRLGAPVPVNVMESFVKETFNLHPWNFKVKHDANSNAWSVSVTGYSSRNEYDLSAAGLKGHELLELCLNLRQAEIRKEVSIDGEKRMIRDDEKTAQARARQREIQELFANWLWTSEERALQVTEWWNQKFNNIVERRFDGSYLTFPGLATEINGKPLTLRTLQRNAIAHGIHNKSSLMAQSVGAGKAQPLTAKVLTPSGWVQMGDLKVGDEVISVDGKPTTVIGVFPQGKKKIYRVTFSDGASTECCDEHLWLTQTYAERNSAVANPERPSAQPKIRHLSEIRQTLKAPHRRAKNHSIPMVRPVQFDEANLPLHPYLLGVIIGDGAISHDVASISCPDFEIIDRCEKVLPLGVRIKPEFSDRCPEFKLLIDRSSGIGKINPVVAILKKLNLQGKKSIDKFIPREYLTSSVEQRIDLLRGLMDTDGTVQKNGSSCFFNTSSEQLAHDVIELVQSLGGTGKLHSKIPTYTYRGELRTGHRTYQVTVSLPPEINPFYLPRKADKVVPKSKYVPTRYITEVEYVGEKEAQCIAVDHPTHLYVTDDYIVTHNTLIMICLAVKLKQMGLVRKPMISVLNSTLPQWKKAILAAYPGVKLLAPEREDFQKRNRRKLFAKIANGDWDIVLVPHSQFSRIPMSKEATLAYYRAEAKALQDDIRAMGGSNGRGSKNFIVKVLERNLREIERKIAKVASMSMKDDTVAFELLNIDALFVDEFHVKHKKAGLRTKLMGIAGIDTKSSSTGIDLLMKVRYLQSIDGRIVYASGTPITNTLGEMFTIMNSLQPEDLREAGIHSFDAWVASFGEIVTSMEVNPAGKFLPKTRLSRFTNLQQLVNIYRKIANVVLPHELRRPKDWEEQRQRLIEQGKEDEVREKESLFLNIPAFEIIQVACPPSQEQVAYMESLVERSLRIKSGAVDTSTDNMLKVTTDGRKACIDMRLVSPLGSNYIDGKLNKCALNIYKIWKATSIANLAQLVFIDFGTLKGKIVPTEQRLDPETGKMVTVKLENKAFMPYDNYKYLRDLLPELGIPKEQIAIIHEHDSDTAKLKLQDDLNSGKVRVLIASTEKGGIGLNIQTRMVAEHHVDAPWRPDGIEQREGRPLRDGNLCSEVLIFRYVSQGANDVSGFDSFLWQTLETKANAFTKVMSASSAAGGPVEDISPVVLSYAQMKALATGDTRILRKAQLDQEIAELSSVLKGAERELSNYQINLGSLPQKIDRTVERLAKFRADRAALWPENYNGLIEVDGSKDDGKDETESDAEIAIGKRYLPFQHGIQVTVFSDQDSRQEVTDPRILGGFIVKATSQIYEQKAYGRHKIGEIMTPECNGVPFRIVIELSESKSIQTGLYRDDNSERYNFVVSNTLSTIRSLFGKIHSAIDIRISDEEHVEERLRRTFTNSQPQIDRLSAQVRSLKERLDPLVAEQRELDKLFGPDLGDNLTATEDTGVPAKDSDDDEADDEFFFDLDSTPAAYDGIEPWIPAELLRRAVDDIEPWESKLPRIALDVVYKSSGAEILDVKVDEVETAEAPGLAVAAQEAIAEVLMGVDPGSAEGDYTVEVEVAVTEPVMETTAIVLATPEPEPTGVLEVLESSNEDVADVLDILDKIKVKRARRRNQPAIEEGCGLFDLFG